MSRRMSKIISVIIVLLSVLVAQGQTDAQCIDMVKKYNEQIRKLGKPAAGKVYYVDFEQELSYWDSDVSSPKQRVKYYVSVDQVHLISSEISTYTNKEYVFTVMHKQKKILVSRNPESDPEFDGAGIFGTFLNNQEHIISKATVSECSEVSEKGLYKVVLDVSQLKINGFHADKLTYYFDSKTKKLKKTITSYGKGYQLRRMSITYYDFQTDYKYTFPKDLVGMFLDSKGKLKPKYNGYELITN